MHHHLCSLNLGLCCDTIVVIAVTITFSIHIHSGFMYVFVQMCVQCTLQFISTHVHSILFAILACIICLPCPIMSLGDDYVLVIS